MEPLIIKLGGVLLDNEEALTRFFTALQQYRSTHSPFGHRTWWWLFGG